MKTSRSEWEEDKYLTAEHESSKDLKNYSNLLTAGSWSTKYPKVAHVLALVGVDQKLAVDPKKSSDKSNTPNRETTKGYPSHIMDIPPWML